MQRKTLEAEGSEEPSVIAPPTPVVAWIHEGKVYVSIIDTPPRPAESGCRCGGCHACVQADLAARFLPD